MICNNAMLKENAKIPLRQTYWMAFAVSLFYLFIDNIRTRITFPFETIEMFIDELIYNFHHMDVWNYWVLPFTWFSMLFGLLITAVGIAFKVFVSNPFEISTAGFFMSNRNAPAKFTEVFKVFDKAYLKRTIVMFMRDLFISLWTLVFIIPGVIAQYKYWAVKYILNENPNLSWQHALDLSKRMTYGRKWDLFVLQISFIGWYILGALLCGLGVIFVNPYAEQTYAEAYEFIKQDALQSNRISYNEFTDLN